MPGKRVTEGAGCPGSGAAHGAPAEHRKRVRVPCAGTLMRGAFVLGNGINRERLFCHIDESRVSEVQGNESNSRVRALACSPVVDEVRPVSTSCRLFLPWVNASSRDLKREGLFLDFVTQPIIRRQHENP